MYAVQLRPHACEAAHRDAKESGACAMGWQSTIAGDYLFKWPVAVSLQIETDMSVTNNLWSLSLKKSEQKAKVRKTEKTLFTEG